VDPALIAVLVTVLVDIVAKVLNTKKQGEAVKTTADAVDELKTIVTQQVALSTAINRRVEVLEHRVAYLENYRPGVEKTDTEPTRDNHLDSAWPPHRKRGTRH
jgi:hypothetical protein